MNSFSLGGEQRTSAKKAASAPQSSGGRVIERKASGAQQPPPPADASHFFDAPPPAPRIQPPRMRKGKQLEANIDEIMQAIGAATTDSAKAQVGTALAAVESKKNERKEVAKRVEELIEQAKKSAEDAKAKIEDNKKTAWVNTALEMLGAAAAVAAAFFCPAMAAVAVASVLLASDSMANQIVQSQDVTFDGPGGPNEKLDISIGGLVNMAFEQAVKDGNIVVKNDDGKYVDSAGNVINDPHRKPGALELTTQQYQDAVSYTTLGVNIAIAAAMMAAGGRSMVQIANVTKNAAEGAKTVKTLSTLAANAERVTNGIGALSDIGGGVTSIVQGANTLKIADLNRSAADAQAYKIVYDAMFTKLAQDMEMGQTIVRDAMAAMTDNFDRVSQSVTDVNDASIRIAHYI